MPRISRPELVSLLSKISVPTVVEIKTKTSAKLPKSYNTLGQVWKHTTLRARLNFTYDPTIQQRAAEQNILLHPREYYRTQPACPVVFHADTKKEYLWIMPVEQIGKILYHNAKGQSVSHEELFKLTRKPQEHSQDSLVHYVVSVESIVSVVFDGTTFQVT